MCKLFVIAAAAFHLLVMVRSDCTGDKDKGNDTCGAGQSIRWYFNRKKFRCMAFTYLGCNGNENNFKTFDDCAAKCIPADGPTCFSGAFATPSPMPVGARAFGPRWCKSTGCPTGYECQSGGMISQCCNAATESWFKEADNPKCKDGQPVLLVSGHIVVGDSCSDLSCPQGSKCEITNQLFAKCC